MKKSVVAILPAYNAARTLRQFVDRLPPGIFDDIFIVDDCSQDGTYELARSLHGVRVQRTPRNLGYGGNLKFCFALALARGADVIVELHPDGEYASSAVKPALAEIEKGASFVLGNRFTGSAIPHGMIPAKYVTTRLLTGVYNRILRTRIPDMHQGFRVYTRNLLERINWRATHDDFLFSFEIICQAVVAGETIASVPVVARYGGKKRGALWRHSVAYTLGTAGVIARVVARNAGLPQRLFDGGRVCPACPVCGIGGLAEYVFARGSYGLFDCHQCRNAFTYPEPADMRAYYPSSYYHAPGLLGRVREFVFSRAQRRRLKWVKDLVATPARICDVGSGAGRLSAAFTQLGFHIENIDPYYSGTASSVRRSVFLRTPLRRLDGVLFWESLEHVAHPEAYLQKAYQILSPGGYLFVEYPRFSGYESRLFGRHWLHLDMPRHLVHFRDIGLAEAVRKQGFDIVAQTGVYAWEYVPAGMALSMRSVLGVHGDWILGIALLVISVPVSLIMALCGHAPIGLLIARKGNTIGVRS